MGWLLSWLEFIKIVWPIASVLTPVVIGAGLLWLRSQFTLKTELASKAAELTAEIRQVEKTTADHATSIKLLEAEANRSPTRQELADKIEQIATGQAGVEQSVAGLATQVGTTNEYLQVIIENGLRK